MATCQQCPQILGPKGVIIVHKFDWNGKKLYQKTFNLFLQQIFKHKFLNENLEILKQNKF